MGKSYKHSRFDEDADDNAIYVALDDIFVSDSTWHKLLDRDGAQIEEMRQNMEFGGKVVRIVLRPRMGGGYNIEDGRHRVIAAKLAGICFIEAMIVGR